MVTVRCAAMRAQQEHVGAHLCKGLAVWSMFSGVVEKGRPLGRLPGEMVAAQYISLRPVLSWMGLQTDG